MLLENGFEPNDCWNKKIDNEELKLIWLLRAIFSDNQILNLILYSQTIQLFSKPKFISGIASKNLIDELQNTYDRPLPASVLLSSNPYDELIQGVINVKDLGSGVIGGTECDYLALRTKDLDWQIWIAQGNRPYPCKYVITSKDVDKQPQYSIQIRDWKTGTDAVLDDFAFNNSTNAEQIAPEDIQSKMSELPENFKRENN